MYMVFSRKKITAIKNQKSKRQICLTPKPWTGYRGKSFCPILCTSRKFWVDKNDTRQDWQPSARIGNWQLAIGIDKNWQRSKHLLLRCRGCLGGSRIAHTLSTKPVLLPGRPRTAMGFRNGVASQIDTSNRSACNA